MIRKCKDNQYFLSPGETTQYCKVSCVKTMCGEYEVMTVMIMMMMIVMVSWSGASGSPRAVSHMRCHGPGLQEGERGRAGRERGGLRPLRLLGGHGPVPRGSR